MSADTEPSPTTFDAHKRWFVDAYEAEEDKLCPHGAEHWNPLPLTKRELCMLAFMNLLTDKPGWHSKVFDEAIVAKWKREAFENWEGLMSDGAFSWCISELRDKADSFKKDNFVAVLDVFAVIVKSDNVIDELLNQELRDACQKLQDLPEELKDYHPNSNKQVVNIVHPSLFPVVYGTTRALESGTVNLDNCAAFTGLGVTIPLPGKDDEFFSEHFQWLPSEVKFDGEESVKFTSYINNLHPKEHAHLYAVLEKIIAKAIPLWNSCLLEGQPREDYRRIQCWEAHWDIKEPEVENDAPLQMADADGEGFDAAMEALDETIKAEGLAADTAYYEGVEIARWERNRQTAIPDPPEYDQGSRPWVQMPIDLRRDFREKGLQVIVKLAGIELTPDRPSYDGGNWHLEGMLNERIAATAIYYYDCENVIENDLAFRTTLDSELDSYWWGEEMRYEQFEFEGLNEIFGIDFGEDECLQELGSVKTRQGRLLVFPNTLQHRVSPLKLIDSTKPGHRRFLVLWLIDPHISILSTANVPPQQRPWWEPKVLEKSQAMADLPTEILEMIFNEVGDVPMSLERAKELRLELMEERSRYSEAVDEKYQENRYFFCEH